MSGRTTRDTSGKQGKAFFSEEKKQKTFGPAVAEVSAAVIKGTKVFWFFFQKRTARLAFHRSPPGFTGIKRAMRPLAYLLFATLLALLSAAVVRVMIRVGTLDHPGARSSHSQPTPKGGGVGIVAAFLAGMLVLYAGGGRARVADAPFLGLIAASVLIAAISYADDVRSWSFTIKLAAQLAACLVAIGSGLRLQVLHTPWLGAIDTGWLGIPLTAAWILLATNAVNFIDGLNGLASGSVGIACLVLAGIAGSEGDLFTTVAALVLAAGIVGFLPYNFPHARIFMGDVGSQFCGFVLAVLGVLASRFGTQTLSVLLVPMMLAGILFDVVFTLGRRAVVGERLTEAHRSHLYQVANRAGLTAWKVSAVYWIMAAWGGFCCVAFGLVPVSLKPLMPVVALMPQPFWLTYVWLRARRSLQVPW